MKTLLLSATLFCGVLLSPASSFAFVWTEVPGPASPKNPAIYGLASLSSSDAWAVGAGSQGDKTLIERWDGTAWNVVPNPVSLGQLRAVTALSSDDAWAVGRAGIGSNAQTLVEHWDGSQWVEVPSPNVGTCHRAYLSAVEDAFGANIDYAMLQKIYGNAPDGQKRATAPQSAWEPEKP